MAFDPDAYLAGGQPQGFDPDAYLASSAQPVSDPEQPVQQAQPKQTMGDRVQSKLAEKTGQDSLRQKIVANPAGATMAEFGAAVNRGAVNLLDFFGPDAINAALELSGVDYRLPTFGEGGEALGATQGGYMEPGLAREAVQTAGEFVAPGGVAGQSLRTAAKAIPAVQQGARTLGQRVTQQLGQSTGRGDVAASALSGAGFEVGGEGGKQADIAMGGTGETGEKVGQIAGSFGLPIAGSIIKEVGKNLATTSAKKLLQENAPTIDGLKQAARQVYGEIDDLGAVVNSSRVDRLGNELQTVARKAGFNARINPKVAGALDEFQAIKGMDQSVTELDVLRKVARNAARSPEPEEARIGTLIVNKIDDFMDNLKPSDFKQGGGDVGAKYRDARQLWQRAKKSEMLQDAFEKARNQASGFENGIRVQFRSILNNKKKLRGFSQEEIDAMKKVVRGGTAENIAKTLGRLGFSEGQATNMLMGSLGVAGGAAIGGAPGAVAVPLIGQMSRNLAQKLTRNNAEAADLIARAGRDGLRLARAYVKAIPKSEQNPTELAELLLRPGMNIKSLEAKIPEGANKKLISDAIYFANVMKQTENND